MAKNLIRLQSNWNFNFQNFKQHSIDVIENKFVVDFDFVNF
jgi:hypothetical protein